MYDSLSHYLSTQNHPNLLKFSRHADITDFMAYVLFRELLKEKCQKLLSLSLC